MWLFAESADICSERTSCAIVSFAVTTNVPLSENSMVQSAVTWLQDRLPDTWEVGLTSRPEFRAPNGSADAAIDLRGPNGTFTTMVVEVKRAFGPRDVERLFTGIGRTLRALAGHIPILLVAPWLSARTRELLAAEELNFFDLTGNVRIRLENPALYIDAQGAARDPAPPPRTKARVQGPKAGRLIRLLVDVRPPYGVTELAAASGLTKGYVSAILETLDDEALLQRAGRGRVESVDAVRLVRRWAETYDVFRSNGVHRYLAPGGAGDALERLGSFGVRVAVTGSFAAVRLAPVAAPALLAAYTEAPEAIAQALGCYPADQGANLALLEPFDPVVWERTSFEGLLTYVAPSQIAVDCLTGNGRMPAEGDAVLQWMTADEARWRLPALSPLSP
jgi:hypothetical protein